MYEVESSGPIVVNKLDNAYILSSTLRHMRATSAIIRISDPQKLFETDEFRHRLLTQHRMGSSHREGSEKMFSGDIDIGTSFIRDNALFHLYEEDGITKMGVLEKKKSSNNDLNIPYSLTPVYRFTSNINARLAQVTNNDEHLLINQSTHESMGGMILIKDDSILFYYFK